MTGASSRPLLVLAVMDTAIVSGPGRQLAALVAPLAARGIELRPVLIRRAGWNTHPYAEFLAQRNIPFELLTDRSALDPSPIVQFHRLVLRLQPAIIQTHGYRPTVLAWLARRMPRQWKWVGFHHGRTNEGLKVRLYHHLDLALLPAADQVVVVAEAQRKLVTGAVRVLVFRNAVLGRQGMAEPAVAPRAQVAVVGRLSPEKGVDVFLDACRLLRDEGMTVSAIIAGDGPERAALEQRARDHGLDDVRFLGQLRDATPVYDAVDLVVLPSRSEGLPNTLLEAIDAGRRCVATDVGAVAEVLNDSALGLVVPPGTARKLAEAMRAMLTSEPSEATRQARRRVLDTYSLESRVAAHEELYRRLSVTTT